MGMEVVVPIAQVRWKLLLETLAARGLPGMIVMVDGALQMPGAQPPETWKDVRLRFPVGTVTLARRAGGVAVVVFGNADAGLQQAQQQLAAVLTELG